MQVKSVNHKMFKQTFPCVERYTNTIFTYLMLFLVIATHNF